MIKRNWMQEGRVRYGLWLKCPECKAQTLRKLEDESVWGCMNSWGGYEPESCGFTLKQ